MTLTIKFHEFSKAGSLTEQSLARKACEEILKIGLSFEMNNDKQQVVIHAGHCSGIGAIIQVLQNAKLL